MGQVLSKMSGIPSSDHGTCGADLVGWEVLDSDVKQEILGKLNLRDLARVARVCRQFRTAYHNCAAKGRGTLEAAGREAYGGVSYGFATALRRAVAGHSPCPCMNGEGEHNQGPICRRADGGRLYTAGTDVLITNSGAPRYATLEDVQQKTFCGEPFGIILKHDSTVGPNLEGYLESRQGTLESSTSWALYEVAGGTLNLDVDLPHPETIKWTLGTLLHLCRKTPEAFPASYQSPLTIELCLRGEVPVGEAGVRAADDLLAPLRPFVESITTDRGFDVGPVIVTLKV